MNREIKTSSEALMAQAIEALNTRTGPSQALLLHKALQEAPTEADRRALVDIAATMRFDLERQ